MTFSYSCCHCKLLDNRIEIIMCLIICSSLQMTHLYPWFINMTNSHKNYANKTYLGLFTRILVWNAVYQDGLNSGLDSVSEKKHSLSSCLLVWSFCRAPASCCCLSIILGVGQDKRGAPGIEPGTFWVGNSRSTIELYTLEFEWR